MPIVGIAASLRSEMLIRRNKTQHFYFKLHALVPNRRATFSYSARLHSSFRSGRVLTFPAVDPQLLRVQTSVRLPSATVSAEASRGAKFSSTIVRIVSAEESRCRCRKFQHQQTKLQVAVSRFLFRININNVQTLH